MPKATKEVRASLKPKSKPKESKANRVTQNSNKDNKPNEKKRETEKDPNAPKRPLSAYMMYCADTRDKVREENPGAPITEITRILGRQWKKLPHDAKTPYQAKHEVAKNQWEIDKALHEKGIRSKPLPEDADEEDTGDEDFDI
ncbi:Non-histone chromosomal protein 6 [Podila clonocystis]|nr:Non-histone chromosomal protein 6 [Podila clonocystis]